MKYKFYSWWYGTRIADWWREKHRKRVNWQDVKAEDFKWFGGYAKKAGDEDNQ